MSTTIDERVVEMRFDNKQFESNVATSMSTLEKLKKSLNLSGASKGLEDVNTAAKRVDMSGLGGAVETVKAKFSALDVVAITALANITNSAVNAGKRIVSALTIDPIKTGFQEYETQINSVQTILANTSSKGTTLDQVNAALDELNHYADLTIYNFTEMTRNIGTFTAAGVDLNTSVNAIQGIANLAAVSGSTSQQASTAMYQLSQALASGTVKLMDWNSVVNAGMGGEVFQNALKETSRLLGTGVDAAIEAEGSFRESLRTGWLTAEVLTETLKKFTTSGANEYVAEYTGLSSEAVQAALDNAKAQYGEADAIKQASQALAEKSGKNASEIESILSMAKTAEDAATKVKTFSQLWDTLKEAAQSGWTQSWELIIGDFEEAKESFTKIHGLLSGAIESASNSRNSILEGALASNWDTLINKVNEAGIETDAFEKKVRECAKSGGEDIDSLITKYGSLKEAFRNGLDTEYLKEAFKDLTTSAKETMAGLSVDLSDIFPGKYGETTLSWGSDAVESIKKVQTALTELGFELPKYGIDGIFEAETRQAVIDFQKSVGLAANGIVDQATIDALVKAGEAIEQVGEASEKTGLSIDELVDGVTKLSGRELLFGAIQNSLEAIIKVISTFRDAWGEIFTADRLSSGLYNALNALHSFSERMIMSEETAEKLKSAFKGVIAIIDIFTSIVGGAFKASFGILGKIIGAVNLDIGGMAGTIGDVVVAFRDWLTENDIIAKGFEKIVEIAGKAVNAVKEWIKSFADIPVVRRLLDRVKNIFKEIADSANDMDGAMKKVKALLEAFKELPIVQAILDGINNSIKNSISAIRRWFEEFKNTDSVQKLIAAVEGLINAFDKLFSGELDSSEFASALGENLGKALASLPGIAIQIASDFIAGFKNGIIDSASGIISSVIEFCSNFVASFAAALGVQSPSWKAYDVGVDFFQGFINGIKAMVGSVVSVLKKIGEAIVKVFKSLWGYITDENGDIEWGKLFAAGILVSAVWFLKQIATAFSGIAKAFGGIGDLLYSVSNVLNSFSKTLNSIAWDFKAKALLKMAIAIGVLVAAIWVLTQIDDIGKLWNAVGVIAVLSAILVGLALAMNKLSAASVAIDKSGAKIDGLKSGLLQIGLAILLVAYAVKLIDGIEDTGSAFKKLAGIAAGLLAFFAVLGLISMYSKDVSGFGSTLLKLSIAMALMIGVCKLAAKLTPEEMLKGAAFATGFAVFVGILVKILSIGNDKQMAKVGGLLISVSFSLALMVGVCKLVGMLSAAEMLKGAAFAAGFVLFLKCLVKILSIGNDKKLAKVSGLVLSISFSLALMVGVCKLISKLSIGEVISGAAFVAGFTLFLKHLVKILAIGNEQQMAKVASTLLAMSVAIAILAAVSVALGFVDLGSLAKGIVAVGLLSGMMALMVKSLKGAQNAKGAIMTMAIAIGVMAAAVVALSFIDPASVMASATAMSIMMAAFSLMVKSLKGLKTGEALKGTLALVALMVPLFAFIRMLYLLNGVDDSTTKIIALTVAMGALVLLLGVLAAIGKTGWSSVIGIAALCAMMIPIKLFTDQISKLNGVENIKEKIIALTSAMGAMTLLLGVLTVIGAFGPASFIGIGALATLFIAIGGLALVIGAAMNSFPSIRNFLDTGLPVLEQLAESIGTMIGKFASGVIEGVSGSIVKIGEDVAAFMEQMSIASESASGIKSGSFDGVSDLLLTLAGIGATSVWTSITDFWSFITTGQTSVEKFGNDGAAFFKAMQKIGEASSGISVNAESMDSIISIANKLSGLSSSLEPIGGFSAWLSGHTDLATFGENAGNFIGSMKTMFESLDGIETFNTGAIDQIVSAATSLSTLQSSLDGIGGLVTLFNGKDDLSTFGKNAGKFIGSMKTIFESLDGIETFNTGAIDQIVTAATSLSILQSSLEPIGGVISWFNGRSDLATFGTSISSFISSMKTAMVTLNGAELDATALDSVIAAATRLSEFSGSLDSMGGVITWFTGRTDLGTFGVNIGLFADAMGKLKSGMGENGISEAVTTSITNAGNAIIALQNALPTEHLFDGKMNLTEFSTYITNFGKAISSFSTTTSSIDDSAISIAINAARRIKNLIVSLSDLDTNGLSDFIGGSFSDGAAVNIAQAMSKFSKEVSDINVQAVSTSVTTAIRLRTLINTLSGLDSSGIAKFKPVSVGEALKSYSNSVANLNTAAINNSISVANKVKAFISSLSNFKTGGINSFKSAVDSLSTVNLNGVNAMISEYSASMQSSGVTLANSLTTGLQNGLSTMWSALSSMLTNVVSSIRSRGSAFRAAGRVLVNNLASGISSGRSSVLSAASGVASGSVSSVRNYYSSFWSAGKYLVLGFCAGITENTWRAEAKAALMANAAYESAKEALDVNSPSKVFKRLGSSVPEGFALGLGMFGSEIEDSAIGMANTAIKATRSAMSTVLDALNSDMDSQPTIRPIMDLSDVKTGANAIHGMLNGVQTVGVRTNLNAISSTVNGKLQNGTNDDVVSAINKLNDRLGNVRGDTYTFGNFTYDDGSNISDTIKALIRYSKIGGRV